MKTDWTGAFLIAEMTPNLLDCNVPFVNYLEFFLLLDRKEGFLR
jgi:hypothetical protein